MAITGKLKKDAYHAEGADKAAKTLDFNKIKAEAKNAAKKLVNSTEPGTKTPFFVKKDYFKDAKGKVAGHFLALGNSNLDKEFKKEKTAADVAYGNFFVKKINDKDTAHFEYVTGQGKLKKPADWKVLLKEFKKAVKLPCVFVIDGETVNDLEEGEEETTAPASDAAPAAVNLDGLISKAQEIKTAIAGKKITKEIIATAQEWIEKFKEAAAEATPELKKDAGLINQLVAKVAAKREQGGAAKGGDSAEAVKQLEQLQKDIAGLIDGLGGTDGLKKMANV